MAETLVFITFSTLKVKVNPFRFNSTRSPVLTSADALTSIWLILILPDLQASAARVLDLYNLTDQSHLSILTLVSAIHYFAAKVGNTNGSFSMASTTAFATI